MTMMNKCKDCGIDSDHLSFNGLCLTCLQINHKGNPPTAPAFKNSHMPAPGVPTRPGSVLVHQFPAGEIVVAMNTFNGVMFVATTEALYQLINGELHKVPISNPDDEL